MFRKYFLKILKKNVTNFFFYCFFIFSRESSIKTFFLNSLLTNILRTPINKILLFGQPYF